MKASHPMAVKKNKIPPELLQKIKDSTNLLELVGEHVVLRKAGANYVGLCPFHSERSPSFSVNEMKQLYHCYGCKKGGDSVSFIMDLLGVSFYEALEELAERGKVALPAGWSGSAQDSTDASGDRKNQVYREKMATAYKLNRFAAAFFYQKLAGHPRARQYFEQRGVSADWIRLFYLGASLESWDQLANHLVEKQAPLDLALELGLIRISNRDSKETQPGADGLGVQEASALRGPRSFKKSGSFSGTSYFDGFRNRVLFPIVNLRGKVAGFGGRVLDDGSPKYLNSPESLVFQKSKLAFGLYQAQKFIREQDEVILVEGYFDVLAMHAAGFKNTVATCGTALTSDHLMMLKRLGSRITLLFDGDAAGISATERAMELGLDHGLVLHGAKMPPGLDPDEIFFDSELAVERPEGWEKMKSILGAAQPLLDSGIEKTLLEAQAGPEEKTQAVKKIAAWLGRFKDPIGREVRLQGVRERLGVSEQLLVEAIGREKKSGVGRGSGDSSLGASALMVRGSESGVRSAVASPGVHADDGSSSEQGALVPASSLALRSSQDSAEFKAMDQILLAGVFSGEVYLKIVLDAASELPKGVCIAEIFEYPPARALFSTFLVDQEVLERLLHSPASLIQEDWDLQIRTTLTAFFLADQKPFSLEDFKSVVYRRIGRIWARFSQQIRKAIADAEISKDIEYQAGLMKEYLDVQRKMKDFICFYDEA
ncbi:MAG: DNA primase [Bdellovibrionia bacterium]